MPSSALYLIAAIIASIGLFLALWWMLVSGGDEAPWLPAGLAASVVLLVALSAREVVMRRAWTRYLLENGINTRFESHRSGQPQKKSYSSSLLSAALRAIQKQSLEADAPGATPESHLEVFHLCQEYLTTTDEALRTNLASEKTIALRSGQERVRAIQKHHMLTWARDTTRLLTREAQQKARVTDKIETANRALECLESALKAYPEEPELNESRLAIREYIASVKVAHWVELAERAAFKGHYKRAINRYMDALFYLNRETMKEEVRAAGAEKIQREIDALRTMVESSNDRNEEPRRNGGGRVEA
jgi:tetratricopeptide (TPR) repeat protein